METSYVSSARDENPVTSTKSVTRINNKNDVNMLDRHLNSFRGEISNIRTKVTEDGKVVKFVKIKSNPRKSAPGTSSKVAS